METLRITRTTIETTKEETTETSSDIITPKEVKSNYPTSAI